MSVSATGHQGAIELERQISSLLKSKNGRTKSRISDLRTDLTKTASCGDALSKRYIRHVSAVLLVVM